MGITIPAERQVRSRSYSGDFAEWAEDTARAIDEGRFDEIDHKALANEVRSLIGAEQNKLESALNVLLTHLLKVKYEREKQTWIWERAIAVQRAQIKGILKKSPSLRAKFDELIPEAYQAARQDAESRTGIYIAAVPEVCEWTATGIRTVKSREFVVFWRQYRTIEVHERTTKHGAVARRERPRDF